MKSLSPRIFPSKNSGAADIVHSMRHSIFLLKFRFERIFYVNSSSTSSIRDRGEYVGPVHPILHCKRNPLETFIFPGITLELHWMMTSCKGAIPHSTEIAPLV